MSDDQRFQIRRSVIGAISTGSTGSATGLALRHRAALAQHAGRRADRN